MDTVTATLLAAFESIPMPPSDDSAWKSSYDRLLGAFACLIACRGPYVARENNPIYRNSYHKHVRLQMPQLLRAAISDGDRPNVNWYQEDFALWSCGFFWNDAELRIATTFEKTLRILIHPLDEHNIFGLTDLAREFLKNNQNSINALKFLDAFHQKEENYFDNVLIPLSKIDSASTDNDAFEHICAEIPTGAALRYIWDKYNKQKHNPIRTRDWINELQVRKKSDSKIAVQLQHLKRQSIEWSIGAAALVGWSKAYSEIVLCYADKTDNDMKTPKLKPQKYKTTEKALSVNKGYRPV